MDKELKAKNFYRPLVDELRCNGDEEVGSVLNTINSVHGALIAFNNDNNFLGVLSTYKCLYKNHTPPAKKVSHAVIHPMIITKDTPLFEIARFMVTEKIYLLPVFEKEKVIGTVSAEDLVKRMLHDQNLLLAASGELKIDHPLILQMNAKVKEAYSLLRSNGISEIVITDKLGKVCGAVTRADIKHAFINPTDKQRFHHDNYRPDDLSFDAEKKRREDDPIRNYTFKLVPLVSDELVNTEIIMQLITSDTEYIILTDKASQPTGILSYRNLLEAFANLTPEQEVNIICGKPSRNVSDTEFRTSFNDLQKYVQKMNKRFPIERAEVRIKEPKFTTRKTAEYDITLQIDPYTGGQYIAYSKAKTYSLSLHAAMKQMEKKLQRAHLKHSKHRNKSVAQLSTENQLYR